MFESREFRAVVRELLTTLHSVKVQQPEVIENHLQTAQAHYEAACAQFANLDMVEADRLARLAYVQLDSAQKCAWFLNI